MGSIPGSSTGEGQGQEHKFWPRPFYFTVTDTVRDGRIAELDVYYKDPAAVAAPLATWGVRHTDRVGQDAETRPAASSSSFSAGSIASASSSMSLAISGVVTKPKSTTPL